MAVLTIARTRAIIRDVFLMQIRLFEAIEMRREMSRVSFLMCPFCFRGLLSVLTTGERRRG
jgi:hypothetical protein